MSAMANGKSKVTGILKSNDSFWCIDYLKKFGVDIEFQRDTAYIVEESGKWNSSKLYMVQQVTITRFFPGVLALSKEGSWEIEASKSMSKRPVFPLIDALKELGAEINYLD